MLDHPPTQCTFTASKYRRAEMEQFLKALEAMGLNLSYEFSKSGATVAVTVDDIPDPEEAKLKRTRGAGRKAERLCPPDGSPFSSETPCETFLKWRDDTGATVTQVIEALGIKRSAYYQHHVEQQMIDKIREAHRINPAREAAGLPELVPTLGQIRLGTNRYISKKDLET